MATDLERLIISIEANTKQFERAMRSLEKTTDQAMGGIERSVKSSQSRQEALFAQFGERIGDRFTHAFRKAFISLFSINFAKDAIEAAAAVGDKSAQAFLGAWIPILKALQAAVGEQLAQGLSKFTDATITDLNNIIALYNVIVAKNNELSGTLGFGKMTPIQPIGKFFSNVDTINKEIEAYHKLYDAKKAAETTPKLGPLQAPGAEQLEAFDKVMKNLIFEEQQLGRTAEMQRVYNELKKAGVNIESEYGQAIQITAQRLHQEELQLQALKEANDGLEASGKTFIQGLLDGQSAAESLTAALRKMADVLLDMALHSLFNPGGTPLLQSLFGNLLGLGGWTGGQLPGSGGNTTTVSNTSLGASSRMGSGMTVQHNTAINVSGSVDQKTLAAMNGMIQRNNVRQNAELQRTWGNRQARYAALRGP
jgi:hypothetical protein